MTYRILLAACAATLALANAAAHAAKPNFLWLVGEDTSPSGYSCYGVNPLASTPVIDRLAREGVLYKRFFTTAPVCSASRSAFYTGMYAVSIGAHQHRTPQKKPLPEGVRLLPQWLHDAGYFTALVTELPAEAGFKGAGKTDWNFTVEGDPFDGKAWADLKARQPFFAQINFQETHRTYHAPAKADRAKVALPPYYPDHPAAREDYAQYLDAATELDRKIGVILELLKRDGLDTNTVVMFMGDNGESHVRAKQFCYEEGLWVPFVVRWPSGIPAPKHFAAGSADARLLEAIDVAPTLISLAGAPVPPKMQGRPFLGDAAGEPKRCVFGARDRCDETAMRIRSVRDERYRYIRNFTPEIPLLAPNAYKEKQYPVWNLIKELNAAGKLTPAQAALCAPRLPDEELYDLEADPYEIRNLAASDDPAHRVALARLRGELERWILEVDDQGRHPEPPPAAPGTRKDRKAEGRK